MVVYIVSQQISARALKCSKQILSRELSSIGVQLRFPHTDEKHFADEAVKLSLAFPLKRRTASEARGWKFRANLSHVLQRQWLYVLQFADGDV